MQVITKRHIALYCQRDCYLKISLSLFFLNCFCEKKGKKATTAGEKNDATRWKRAHFETKPDTKMNIIESSMRLVIYVHTAIMLADRYQSEISVI